MRRSRSHLPWTWLVIVILFVSVLWPLATTNAQIRSDNIDVILIVDSSASMATSDPENFRLSAAKLFVDLSDEGDQLAIISMGAEKNTAVLSDLLPASKWLDYSSKLGRKQIKEKIDAATQIPRGGTYMGTALRLAYNILDNTAPGRRQFVILLTDGVPEVENPKVMTDVLNDFEKKRFWKIFPIALGKDADYEMLKREMAGRTGGVAFRVDTPKELIRVYTEIFAMLRYNRYVNWITVNPGKLQTLATLAPDQKITNLAFVVPKYGNNPFIDVIVSPNQTNVVDPGVSGSVYHAVDPRYECFVMDNAQVLLDGEWRGRFNDQARFEIAALVRSDYGIQMTSPPPQESWDELSRRYAPLGTDLYISIGVRNSKIPVEERGGDFYNLMSPQGKLEPLLSPIASMEAPTWPMMTLRDDGVGADMRPQDGQYAGLYQRTENPGEYRLRLEVPRSKPDIFRLAKWRIVEVRPLPTIFLDLPEGQTLQENSPFSIKVRFQQPAQGPVPVNSADVAVTIREPDGNSTTLTAQPQPDHYAAAFVPKLAGPHDLAAVAQIRLTQEGKEIAYSAFTEKAYNVVFPGRLLTVIPEQTDFGTLGRFEPLPVQIQVQSGSSVPEKVKISVQGLQGGVVTPETLEIPPKQTSAFQLMVGTKIDLPPGPGQVVLVFRPTSQSAQVENGSVTFTYNIAYALRVRPIETDLKARSLQDMRVQVAVQSKAPTDQILKAGVDGLPGASVLPSQINVPAGEETMFTFSVSAPAAALQGSFELVLEQPEGSADVQGGRVSCTYLVSSISMVFICAGLFLVAVVAAGGIGFVMYRRREAKKRRW